MEKLTCKACGSKSFTQGKLSGYANVMPVEKIGFRGSSLILTFCKDCGEVASMKIDKPHRFWVCICKLFFKTIKKIRLSIFIIYHSFKKNIIGEGIIRLSTVHFIKCIKFI